MKKAARIILFITSILLAILGLVFLVIEARLLFSGELAFYDHPVQAGFRYAFRLLASLLALAEAVVFFLDFKKDDPILRIYLYLFSVALFFVGAISSLFLESRPSTLNLILVLALTFVPGVNVAGVILLYFGEGSPKKEETIPSEKR
jgi:membrane protease YdiL (CAAX protease family)